MTPLGSEQWHVPVMVAEVRTLFSSGLRARDRVLDCTLGSGGHALELLDANPALRYVGIDADPEARERASRRLSGYSDRIAIIPGYFDDVLNNINSDGSSGETSGGFPSAFDFILFDLGLSIHHFRDSGRGFSFQASEPLDMRLSPECPQTAADLVSSLREEELADIIFKYGEDRHARRIARAIVEKRKKSKLNSSDVLASLVAEAVPPSKGAFRIHPATKTFQALRIAVNDELGRIERALPLAAGLLAPEGLLVVISFHSLEDGLVKRFFRESAGSGRFRELFRTPLEPSDEEKKANPPSRSAKLRALAALAEGEVPARRPKRGELPRELEGGGI